jgi:hypothetical protein
MAIKHLIHLLILLPLAFMSCKEQGPHPSDLVGTFKASVEFKEGKMDKKSVSQEINNAMKEVKDEFKKAKSDIETELDLSMIDTTTTEGKIEYAAKKLGKTFTDASDEIGDLSNDLGNIFSGLAQDGLDLSETLMKNLNANVELQADGDVKIKGSVLSFALSNATWETKGNKFYFYNQPGENAEIFNISQRNDEGFMLENDHILIKLQKIQ